ncbi:hypothetical protein D8S78_13170 [Natrialba swarupiae]|nr:hypothetical protein [Natrialba swarupiae]
MRHDHLITSKQLSRADVETVLDRAAEIDADPSAVADRHAGSLLGLLFRAEHADEDELRSRDETSGGDVVDMGSVESSSVKKGETLADTVRVIEGTRTRSSSGIRNRGGDDGQRVRRRPAVERG